MNRPVGLRDHAIGAWIALAYLTLLIATAPQLAMSRDESFYVHAANEQAAWLRVLLRNPSEAMERPVVDRFWEYNHEHPALIKLSAAVSVLVQERYELFAVPTTAYRLPGMICASLLLWLVYVMGARTYGRVPGAFGALALGLIPRFFYHSHLLCFDIPIVLMSTLVFYCYLRSLTSRAFVIWTGLAYGLALATKHNAWAIPLILLIHFYWVRLREPRGVRSVRRMVPTWLLSMAILGPPIFVGSWPWLWFDTLPRFVWYANFHLHHVHYTTTYFGEVLYQPPFPMSVPWVLTLFTVPLVTMALFFLGLVPRLPHVMPDWLARAVRLPRGAQGPLDAQAVDVLFLGGLLAPIVIISLPWTPIFGGTKHWMPAYPFLALFAGAGFEHVRQAAARAWATRPARLAAQAITTVACFAVPLMDTYHSRRFGVPYYSFTAGGVPGAADYGMNTQFWGYTQGQLAGFFRDRMPHGGTVWPCDATAGAWAMMQADGMIPDNIRATFDLASADFAIVHHEHHFVEVDYQIWTAFGTLSPVEVLTYDGVPIVSVYQNPRRLPPAR